MMVDKNYAIAISELLHYFKGFSAEEIDKIPVELINFFKENADESYKCDFDYNANIEDLHLRDETYGLISMICYNYWCESQEEKKQYLNLLEDKEKEYQEHINEKYNLDNLFISQEKNKDNIRREMPMVKYNKEKWNKKIILFLKRIFKK